MASVRVFTASPHRMLFFGGVSALNLAMFWWLAIIGARAGLLPHPPVGIPPGLIHGWLLIYGPFPFFVLGFLMTALPRWVSAPAVPLRRYGPVAVALYAGFLLAFFGSFVTPELAAAGMAVTALAWLAGALVLLRALRHGAGKAEAPHPRWAVALAGIGWAGAALAAAGTATAHWPWLRAGLYLGVWGFLVPMVFVVAHRMLPFFAARAIPDYGMWRPAWSPAAVACLCFAIALLSIAGRTDWLLLPALPLALIGLAHLLYWRPWRARGQPLLWTAFAAFAWLPVAAGLYTLEAGAGLLDRPLGLGLAPLHAATIGLLAGMVLAFGTRVSRGHSGQPLRMDRLDLTAFLTLQAAAVLRIVAELPPAAGHARTLLLTTVLLWLAAFLPWGLRYGRIYWQPRADGKPG